MSAHTGACTGALPAGPRLLLGHPPHHSWRRLPRPHPLPGDTMRIQVEPESETLTSLEEAPSAQLLRMILGCALNQAIYTFATLGVADLLASAPRGSEELAEATHTDGALLHRVLRALSSANILDELEDGRFALTSVGE